VEKGQVLAITVKVHWSRPDPGHGHILEAYHVGLTPKSEWPLNTQFPFSYVPCMERKRKGTNSKFQRTIFQAFTEGNYCDNFMINWSTFHSP
jgi:hypothetical protein